MKQSISLPQIPKKLLDTNKELYDYLYGLQQALLAKQTDDYGAVDKVNTDIADITTGWTPSGETWTYASADSPSFTFTVPGDQTGKYSAGMRIKLTQTTVKYFIITAVSYASGTGLTTITVYGGTDYDLTSDAITSPYYSVVKAPFGFPMSSDKWRVKVTGGGVYKNSPTAGVFYGGANAWDAGSNVTISAPIGQWRVKMFSSIESLKTGAQCDILVYITPSNSTGAGGYFDIISGYQIIKKESPVIWHELLPITTKTTYYLLAATSIASTDAIRFYWSNIYFECAYL